MPNSRSLPPSKNLQTQSSASGAWINDLFAAKEVANGGVVRRNKKDVEKYASFKELLYRVRLEEFHLIETGDQYVIICNPGVLKIHV